MKPNSTRHVLTSASCKAVRGNYYLIFLNFPLHSQERGKKQTYCLLSDSVKSLFKLYPSSV